MFCLHHCLCSWKPEEGIRSPGTRVIGSCELPSECWELGLVPVEECSYSLPFPAATVLLWLRHTCLGMAPPTVGWDLLRQLATVKMLHKHDQSDGGDSTVEVPPSKRPWVVSSWQLMLTAMETMYFVFWGRFLLDLGLGNSARLSAQWAMGSRLFCGSWGLSSVQQMPY